MKSVGDLLAQLGFNVLGRSGLQITVEAPKERFEAVFRSRLRPLGPTRRSRASFWQWRGDPQVPADLRDAVETVVLPQPLALHDAAIGGRPSLPRRRK